MTDAGLVHTDVASLAFLLGTWEGSGRGLYPTIDPFDYGEEMRFSHVGRPYLLYSQRTWILPEGRLSHAETGYWRGTAGGVELVLAHPNGLTEIETGGVEAGVIEVASSAITGTPTAKAVTAMRRRYEVDGDSLRYQLWMAAVGEPLSLHLEAELHRAS